MSPLRASPFVTPFGRVRVRGGAIFDWLSFFRPDSYSYNSAIAACGPGGGADDARALLEVILDGSESRETVGALYLKHPDWCAVFDVQLGPRFKSTQDQSIRDLRAVKSACPAILL